VWRGRWWDHGVADWLNRSLIMLGEGGTSTVLVRRSPRFLQRVEILRIRTSLHDVMRRGPIPALEKSSMESFSAHIALRWFRCLALQALRFRLPLRLFTRERLFVSARETFLRRSRAAAFMSCIAAFTLGSGTISRSALDDL